MACGPGGPFAWNGDREILAAEGEYRDAAISANGETSLVTGHKRLFRVEPPPARTVTWVYRTQGRSRSRPTATTVVEVRDGFVEAFAAAGEPLRRLDRPATGLRFSSAPTELAFSPDGTLPASAHDHGDVHVWHTGTGRHVRRLRGLHECTSAVVFVDDHHLAAAGRDVEACPPVSSGPSRPSDRDRRRRFARGAAPAALLRTRCGSSSPRTLWCRSPGVGC